ncbi:MAG: hypothetical protein LPK12_17725 [Rhodobacterales bacterium]|nr:hypothetical protein [Rhodobacterales bacterium]MDX5501779.1 hypothetical protein [Rhodobacterales bacterium]
MSLIRPELAARLTRAREAIGAGLALAFGLWLATRGGWLLAGLGGAVALVGAGLLVAAIQRLRFAPATRGPGVVEVDEGQIAWFGPGIGGFVSLAELAELGLITVQGLRVWRLRQSDGQMLLVPVDAQGAGQLYDALTTLPGIEGHRLLAALGAPGDTPLIWQRAPSRILPFRRP